MDDLRSELHDLTASAAAIASAALTSAQLGGCDDAALLGVLAEASRLGRLVDAVLVATTAEVQERCASADRADRLSSRRGCRDVDELLRRVTRCSGQRAGELRHAAAGVHRPIALTTGELLPAEYPALRETLARGEIWAEGLSGVFRALDRALPAATTAQRLAADAELSAAASGAGDAPPVGTDDLRMQAQVWATVLDQDGAEPRADRAVRMRELRVGRLRDGLVPIRGSLLPDVAAQLELLADAIDNPKRQPGFEPSPGPSDDGPMDALADRRTRGQRRHDALATILVAAAGCADLPSLGGAPPTLTVVARAEDLVTGRGYAHIDGVDGPVPLECAVHVGCVGKLERITCDAFGRVLDIQVQDRIFTAHQRRAIAARDGGCIIPGCRVKASWCEIHHVIEAAKGGPTSIDNGVMLCWFHHRTLGTSGWEVRIRHGRPEVRGAAWWDPHRRWRRAGRHPIWMRPRAEGVGAPVRPRVRTG